MSEDDERLPAYDELPALEPGGRCAWGLFGPDDNVGLVNLMTPGRVAAAARLIRRGAMFPLDLPIDTIDPGLAKRRGLARHTLLHNDGDQHFDDVYDNFYPQASSQWDALGHFGYQPGVFYNGATEADVAAGRRATIEHWAQHGIAGRAVLLDVAAAAAANGRPADPDERTAYTVDDLEAARRHAGVELRTGDILLIRTGFLGWYRQQPFGVRERLHGRVVAPGLAQGEEMCAYLWDAHVAAIASDTYAVEAWPSNPAAGPAVGALHPVLLGQFGMALGELWWLDDLASDCAADGVYETFLVSVPMNAPGGVGSPANAVAIK